MKKDQVIKALECCSSEVTKDLNCHSCPLCGTVNCMTVLYAKALAIIKDMEKENEIVTR